MYRAGEELFIFYGDKLWFEDRTADAIAAASHESCLDEHMDDPAAFLESLHL